MTDDRRPDEGFQARARIGAGHGARGPILVTSLIAAFLAVAIVKPWDLGLRPGPKLPSRSPGPPASSVAASSGPPAIEPVASASPIPVATRSDEALLGIAENDPRWGMRAIVQSRRGILAGPLLAERWAAATVPTTLGPVPALGDDVSLDAPLGDPSDVAYAIGVTTPPDALPLDIRFWRTSEDRGWARLLPVAIPGPAPGAWLWRPDPTWATVDGTWPSGRYRVDVLLGMRIVRLEAVVPGTFQPWTAMLIDNPFLAPLETRLDQIAPGPFVVTENGPEPIELAADGDFDERTAWLAPHLGDGFVAQAYGTSLSGFGVLAGADSAPTNLLVERLSGVPRPSAIAVELATVRSTAGTRTALLAWPLDGRLLADGLWRLTAIWSEGRAETWLVELQPRPGASVPTSPLEALGRWVLARDTDPGHAPVIDVPGPEGDTVVSTQCQAGTRISPTDPLLGLQLPGGAHVTSVQLFVPDAARAPDWMIAFTGDPVDQMAVVALPAAGLPSRQYDVLIRLADAGRTWSAFQRICVGD